MKRFLLFLALLVALLFFCASCGSVRYVPVETVRTEVEYRDRVRSDSVFVADSVYIRERGDTVLVEHTRWMYRDRVVRDTAFVLQRDSVAVPYPVERQLSRWQEFKMGAFWPLCVVFVLVASVIAWRWRR